MMSPSSENLYILLRAALFGDVAGPLPSDVDWREVIDLSFDQGVAAIAVDGLQKICEVYPQVRLPLDSEELDGVRCEWFGEVLNCDEDERQRMAVIRSLADFWSARGLDTYVLKGMSFARYYPVPRHRFYCDFDCNVRYGVDGRPAWRLADQLVKEKGLNVNDRQSKHSRFVIGELTVENHRHVIGVGGSRKAKRFDAYLQSLLALPSDRLLPDVALYCPCWLFNALFCVSHAKTHFLEEDGIALKYVLDWALIKRDAHSSEHWEQFGRDIDGAGLRKFFDAFDGVVDYVTGDSSSLTDAQRLMLDDILAPKDVRHYKCLFLAHLNILRMIWSNRWKFRHYSETTALATMWKYVYGHFFDRDDVMNL